MNVSQDDVVSVSKKSEMLDMGLLYQVKKYQSKTRVQLTEFLIGSH